jgi:multidrug efflux pump subunit AcrA (membrane-fusion protein)
MERYRKLINAGLGFGAITVALAGLLWLVATKPQPRAQAASVAVPGVDVLTVKPTVFNAPIVGYGTIRPKRQIKIIPEVGGRLVQVHDALAIGNFIPRGDLLFAIDSRVYESRVRQVETEIQRLEAQLRLHEQMQENLGHRLAIATQQEQLALTNLQRDEGLWASHSLSDPERENSQDRYLRQRDVVIAYESELALIPLQVEETTALLKTKQAQLDEAKLSLEKTEIRCPFDARVEAVAAQQWQVVVASLSIATLTDVEALELAAGVDPRELRWTNLRAFARAVGQDMGTAPEAAVTWSLFDREYVWRGPVTRLERVDEITRTAQVVVEIRDVMRGLNLESGQATPPLSSGMFCRVEIPAEPLPDALVVPRSAVYDGERSDDPKFVYVFEADPSRTAEGAGRLGIRRVPLLRAVGDDVLVDFDRGAAAAVEDTVGPATVCELRSGDQVIVSPLPRAVAGMPIQRREAAVAQCGTPHAPSALARIERESTDF